MTEVLLDYDPSDRIITMLNDTSEVRRRSERTKAKEGFPLDFTFITEKIHREVQRGRQRGETSPLSGSSLDDDQSDAHPEKPVKDSTGSKKASFAQSTFNMSNTLMGVGLLTLPYAFGQAGWLGGTICLVVVSLIAWRTSILLGRELNGDPRPLAAFDSDKSSLPSTMTESLLPIPERMHRQLSTFPELAKAAFGETGRYIMGFILYLELFSCICAFFVTIGDHLHQLFPTVTAASHAVLVGVASLIPNLLLRSPSTMAYLSMVGTLATIGVVLSVLSAAALEGDITQRVAEQEGVKQEQPFHEDFRAQGLALAFGLVAYCFSGHSMVPTLYTSMARPQRDFERMVTLSFSAVIACYLAVAMSGYYMFGSLVKDQVTLSLEASSQAQTAMKMLTWLMILTAFSKVALTMFPLSSALQDVVAPYLPNKNMAGVASSMIKISLTCLCLYVSIYVPSFSFLCAIVGMIFCMALTVVFPAAAHLKMFGSQLSMTDKVVDVLFIVLGAVMGIAGTVERVRAAFHSEF